MFKCYDILYNDASKTDYLDDAAKSGKNSWMTKFLMYEVSAIEEIQNGINTNKFADAIQIKIQTKTQPLTLASQTMNFKNNWQCFYKATHQSLWAADGICEKNRNIVYLQKVENQM